MCNEFKSKKDKICLMQPVKEAILYFKLLTFVP